MRRPAVLAGLVLTLALAYSAMSYALNASNGPTVVSNAVTIAAPTGPQTSAANVLANAPVAVDPCESSSVTKSSAVINATATAQIVALVAAKTIFVCGFDFTLGGTTPTAQWQYGTGTTCGTGTTNLTGVYLPTVGSEVEYGGGGTTVFASANANALCLALGGTSPSAQGVVTYVQQ